MATNTQETHTWEEYEIKSEKRYCSPVKASYEDIGFEYRDRCLSLYTVRLRLQFGKPFLKLCKRRNPPGWTIVSVDFEKLLLIPQAIETLRRLTLETEDKKEEEKDESQIFDDYLTGLAYLE